MFQNNFIMNLLICVLCHELLGASEADLLGSVVPLESVSISSLPDIHQKLRMWLFP